MVSIPLNEAKVAFDRMFAFSSTSVEKIDEERMVERLTSPIQINNLSYSFPGRDSLLEGINLNLHKGKFITLLGESGSGKSTLLQVLQKFYSYDQGNIIMDNTDLRRISTTSWRDKLAVVPQQIKLFNGTVLYNITLSEDSEDYKRAAILCEEYGIDKFINNFPQGYGTLIGEGGINLSGGQQQIIAIARALFTKPQLLLLDEATSAMDRNTENFILDLLQSLKQEMMILMVTHRIKTASKSDYIYILNNKSITHHGIPEELLTSNNLFSEAYNDLVM
jgi:ATP-binding cassette subfamily B protein